MRPDNSLQEAARLRPAIIVMVKTPRAGLAKTRLRPMLTDADAAQLAACFAQDVVANARHAARDVIVAYTPADGRHLLQLLLPHDLLWMEQQGRDLGARLEAATARASALGFSPIILLGADSPTLSPSLIRTAIGALADDAADLALGPTEDGGYYLVGLQRPHPSLFQNISWSTPLAYRQTADNAARLKLRLQELPLWYDVDTPEDLLRLRDHLDADKEARARAAMTYRWLLAHDPWPQPSA